MAFDGLKVAEAYFMAGRKTAGKRFLTRRCRPAVQASQQLGDSVSPEHTVIPASARMLR